MSFKVKVLPKSHSRKSMLLIQILFILIISILLRQKICSFHLYGKISKPSRKKEYKFSLGSYRPFAPSLDLPILLQWLYEHNCPQYADEVALLCFSKDFYKQIFGIDLSEAELKLMFNPPKEAGKIK